MTSTITYNPLLERLTRIESMKQLREILTIAPLSNIDVTSLDIFERTTFLSGEKTFLQPLRKTVMAAMIWYGMLKKGLENRNPYIKANRKLHWESVSDTETYLNNTRNISTVSVNVLKGPTGVGKTITISAFLSLFPQVIEHGENEECGWVYLKQLVYLQLNMSHDESKMGFIKSILMQMDEALGTNYSKTVIKSNDTVETATINTISTLLSHYTGIIFIDENQLRNLVQGSNAGPMQRFLLQLMNSRIPIVIVGNERALDWVTYSQDWSRLTVTPMMHFHPIGALDEQSWQAEWRVFCDQGIMKLYLLDGPIINPELCSKTLFECSGGVARLAISLWSSAQNQCLLSAQESICAQDILDVYHSYSYGHIRPLADGFRYKSASILKIYPDVDSEFYKDKWLVVSQEQFSQDNTDSISSPTVLPTVTKAPRTKSELAKFKSSETKKNTKTKKISKLQSSLSVEDMRMQGATNHHLGQMLALKNSLEAK